MKVLLSAYACEPNKGSEPGVGWNWALQIGRFQDVWVLTRPCYQNAIEMALLKQPMGNIRWVYFDLPTWARWWNKNDLGIHLHYYLWQIGAYFVGRRLHRRVGFDVAHHITIACYWLPSFLALLPVPFVWGPVGGGESFPNPFRDSLGFYGKAYETLRNFAQGLGRLDPFVRMTVRRARLGLATTRETEKRIQALGCRKTVFYPTVGLCTDDRLLLRTFPIRHDNPFRVVSMGNLLHLKGFELGLRAFANIEPQFSASEYWIIGDGPERKWLKRLACDLGIGEKVTFLGQLSRAQALDKLYDCDVLLHPSLHDSGGWVCLEAMAAGRPVVCLDLGGPALQVTEETGIKVPAISPDQAVDGMARALSRLAGDLALRVRLGSAARQRVRDSFDWDKKGIFMSNLYESLPILEEGMADGPVRISC
jgi:glycosyltransferase involved in cell wall biosynthesis